MARFILELPKNAVKAFYNAITQLEKCNVTQLPFTIVPEEEDDDDNDSLEESATSNSNIGDARYSLDSIAYWIEKCGSVKAREILKDLTNEFKVLTFHHLSDDQVAPFLQELNFRISRLNKCAK